LDPPFHISGTVADSRTGKPIADFLVIPRYAFTRKTPAIFGEWDELRQGSENRL
jgi:hypothetical protein